MGCFLLDRTWPQAESGPTDSRRVKFHNFQRTFSKEEGGERVTAALKS